LNFLNIFSKNKQTSNFTKIRPVAAELFHADGRTEGHTDRQINMTKLRVAFRTFATERKSFRSRLPKRSATPNNVSTHAFITHQYPHEEQLPRRRVITNINNVLSFLHIHFQEDIRYGIYSYCFDVPHFTSHLQNHILQSHTT
jgi:hypothetical protein